ncbi:hypothetical protein QAD02_021558 [Eretmocerus hayati]|uniref:Uncharacterized protein n=1 Tax=Eretmocerus hayati TaxID=131215 RepID=A0ACC2PQA2_9HYME|nr:hypothetical protein QAD02_021558 [Eretmocerus hayati]
MLELSGSHATLPNPDSHRTSACSTSKSRNGLEELTKLSNPECRKYLIQNRKMDTKEHTVLKKIIEVGGNTLHAMAEIEARSRWSEHVMVHSTYNLPESKYPSGTFLVPDGNGETQYMAVCLVAQETDGNYIFVEALLIFYPLFKETVKSFKGDKAEYLHRVFMTYYPDADMYISGYHVLMIFKFQVHLKLYPELAYDPARKEKLLTQISECIMPARIGVPLHLSRLL